MSDCVSLPAFLSSTESALLGQKWAKSWILLFSAPLAAIRKQLLSSHTRTKLVSAERLPAGVLKAGPTGLASLIL